MSISSFGLQMKISRIDTRESFVNDVGSTIHELAGRVSLPTVNQSLAQVTLAPGAESAEHSHAATEEIYYITSGSGNLRVGDEESEVNVGDCIVIPPGAPHNLSNTGDQPLTLLVCCSPPYHADDTVLPGE